MEEQRLVPRHPADDRFQPELRLSGNDWQRQHRPRSMDERHGLNQLPDLPEDIQPNKMEHRKPDRIVLLHGRASVHYPGPERATQAMLGAANARRADGPR